MNDNIGRQDGQSPYEQPSLEREHLERGGEGVQPGSIAEREQLTTVLRDYLTTAREAAATTEKASRREDKLLRGSSERSSVETEPEMKALVERLRMIDGLAPERWKYLKPEQKEAVVRTAHKEFARAYDFRPYKIEIHLLVSEKKDSKLCGYCDHQLREIHINSDLVDEDNPVEVLSTLAHESRHAYQDHAVSQPLADIPLERQKEVLMWEKNSKNYISFEKNSRRYWNQPVEVDARKFEEMVVQLVYGGK